MHLDPAQLRALAAAVSEGTFDAAARTLHVTPSAVSQRVKALETAVGRVLLTRTKPVRPTPSGETLLRLARQIQAVTDDVARELGDDDVPSGPQVIPLAVNADSMATWFLPALASLGGSLVFDLHRSDQDRTADLLRQGAVMAAVTASAEPVPGCVIERLGSMRYRPMASPAFARRWFPGGTTPAELAHAPVVVFDRDDDLQHEYLRRRTRRRLDPPRHFVPGSTDFYEAVRLGLGWGMLPDLQTAHAADGEFTDLDPRGHIDVRLYWQQWRLRSASLDAVTDAVRAAAATALR
ncbi:LysR family transcriptional regulator ArgP [Prauserella endophytica]|uniref:LysR family transcriptional regulator ArgP n=1 Tax=Prauserella endophytica TaxID=1592324 RepID=A0ABY2S7Y7_9PSEU|nr:LysR family transcriptional regulator ArgP [Prauserella endophytica]TKG72008.1 LysR family transcriptional regulator ArgP [Prauserella endophytica]